MEDNFKSSPQIIEAKKLIYHGHLFDYMREMLFKHQNMTQKSV